MKLSWLNTSMTHKQAIPSICQCKAQRERELEKVDQTQTQRYVSRFEPLLYVPAFTQKDFHYIVHT